MNPQENPTQESVESTDLLALRETKKRYEAAFVRIAKAHGINSQLVLMAMSEGCEENCAEILARHIEESMTND